MCVCVYIPLYVSTHVSVGFTCLSARSATLSPLHRPLRICIFACALVRLPAHQSVSLPVYLHSLSRSVCVSADFRREDEEGV